MVPQPPLLVGRENECQRLLAAWAQASAGQCGVVCLLGDSGSGKSAALHWLAHRCRETTPGCHVLWLAPPAVTDTGMSIAARALEGLFGLHPSPLSELERALQAITGVSEPDILRYEVSLAQYLWGETRPPSQDPGKFEAGALALARRLIVGKALREPVLILLDEAHRLDHPAQRWFGDLLAEARDAGARLMVTGSTSAPKVTDLAPLARECVAESVPLGPLDDAQARLLLESCLASPPPEGDMACVVEAARGNPGCLVLFGEALGLGQPLPGSWESAIRATVEHLKPAQRALVDALSVVGAPVCADLLKTIAGLEPASALPLLPGLMVEGPAGIWFARSAAADIAHGLLKPADLTRLHRRAGNAFAPVSPLVAARHFERAGDREGLLQALGDAARAAHSRNALEEARALLQRAQDSTPADAAAPPEVTLALASIDLTLGAYDDAFNVLSRRVARLEGSDRARAFRLMGRALERKGEYQAARAHHHEGLAVPGDLPARERAGLLAEVATIHLRQGQMDQARRHAEEALAILGADDMAAEFALAHSVIGITYYRQGRFPQSLTHHEVALDRRERMGDLQGTANSLNNLGTVHLEAGNWDESLAAFGRALTLAEAAGDAHTRTALLNNIASLHLARGSIAEAEAACRESLEAKSRSRETPGVGIALATLAAILGKKGRAAEALRTADEAITLLEQLGEREILSDVYACRGELLVFHGSAEDAWDALNRAQQLAEETGRLAIVARVYRVLSELFRLQGRSDDSVAFAAEAVELNRFLPRKLELARSLKQLALVGGDRDGSAATEADELFGLLGVSPSTGAVAS